MSSTVTSQAIKEIERLTKEATRAEFVKRPGDPDHVIHLVTPGGEVEQQIVEPKPRRLELSSPEAFAEAARTEDSYGSDKSVVFYNEAQLVLIMDDTTRREFAICNLKLSPQYRWLKDASKTPLSQFDFVRLLRIDFRGCLPADSNLLSIVRNLKFDAMSGQVGTVQHGRESLGKSVSASVSGEGAIPEEITLTVPVFENFGLRVPIQCAVELLPREQQFRLTPFPLEISEAMETAMRSIAMLFDPADQPMAYHGKP